MNNKILDNNLKFLSKNNKNLSEKLLNLSELKHNYETKEAKSGDIILYKDGKATDDTLDPVWNALERYNNLKSKDIKSITIIYGLGLGYVLKELNKRYKGKIILFEPDIEILRIAFELVDFSEDLNKKNVRIASNYEEVKSAYLDLFFKDYELNIVPNNYYENAAPSETAEFIEQIERIHGTYQSNYRNLIEKAHNWTLCLFNNIPNTIKTQDLHVLKDIYKGKTAVIISAGPSLDKNIEDLKPYRDKVIIFCVGTALKAVIKHGIIPDFAVTIETVFITKTQLDVPEISDINIICATNTFKGIFDLQPKCFINYHSNKDNASKWLAKVFKIPLDDYESAGTVSISALYAAKLMGINKMIFIGQDLAYTDNKCYSKDTHYGGYTVKGKNEVENLDKNKLKDALKLTDDLIEHHMENLGKNLYYIKAYNGGKVLSRSDLILFITYFEEIAKQYSSEINFINSTEGGAYITGFEHTPLKEALKKYTQDNADKELPQNLLKLDTKELKKRKNVVLAQLKEIVKNHYELKDILEKTINSYILPCLSRETVNKYEEFYKYFYHSNEIYYSKRLNNLPLSKDEEEKYTPAMELKMYEKFAILLLTDLINLLNKNPEKFAYNLNIVKNNYFKKKDILNKNPFFHSLLIGNSLQADNAIKDFENNDNNLSSLFMVFSYVSFIDDFIKVKTYGNFIKNIIKELEAEH